MLPTSAAGRAPSQVAQGTWRFPWHSLHAGAVAFCAHGCEGMVNTYSCARATTARRGKRPHPAHAHSSADDRRHKRGAAENGGGAQRKRTHHGAYHRGGASRGRHLRCAVRRSARTRVALGWLTPFPCETVFDAQQGNGTGRQRTARRACVRPGGGYGGQVVPPLSAMSSCSGPLTVLATDRTEAPSCTGYASPHAPPQPLSFAGSRSRRC